MREVSNKKEFYVYTLLDPRKEKLFSFGDFEFLYEPFYVGKGQGKRAWSHFKAKSMRQSSSFDKINEIRNNGYDNPIVIIVKKDLTEKQAFEFEKQLINMIRLSSIILVNKFGGGQGASGFKWNEQQKINGSIAQKKRFCRSGDLEKVRNAYSQWRKINPEKHLEIVEKRNKTHREPDHRIMVSEKMKSVYFEHPEITLQQTLSRNRTFKDNPQIAIQISRKLGGKPIEVYKDGLFVKRFETQHACMRELGLGPCFVTKRLHYGGIGKNGYEIKYASS